VFLANPTPKASFVIEFCLRSQDQRLWPIFKADWFLDTDEMKFLFAGEWIYKCSYIKKELRYNISCHFGPDVTSLFFLSAKLAQ